MGTRQCRCGLANDRLMLGSRHVMREATARLASTRQLTIIQKPALIRIPLTIVLVFVLLEGVPVLNQNFG